VIEGLITVAALLTAMAVASLLISARLFYYHYCEAEKIAVEGGLTLASILHYGVAFLNAGAVTVTILLFTGLVSNPFGAILTAVLLLGFLSYQGYKRYKSDEPSILNCGFFAKKGDNSAEHPAAQNSSDAIVIDNGDPQFKPV